MMTNATNSVVVMTPSLLSSSPVTPKGAYAVIAISAGLGCFGILLNGLAMVVIFGFTTIWKKMNFFLLVNQIVINFASSLTIAAQYLSVYNGDPNIIFFGVIISNDALCRWWYTKVWMWSFLLSSNYNVVLIAFERYLKIVHPILYLNQMTKVTDIIQSQIKHPIYYITIT